MEFLQYKCYSFSSLCIDSLSASPIHLKVKIVFTHILRLVIFSLESFTFPTGCVISWGQEFRGLWDYAVQKHKCPSCFSWNYFHHLRIILQGWDGQKMGIAHFAHFPDWASARRRQNKPERLDGLLLCGMFPFF